MFLIFIKLCNKYRFTYTMTTYGCNNELTLILRPFNIFDNIEIKEKLYELDTYFKVFVRAIKEMKKYREERGY